MARSFGLIAFLEPLTVLNYQLKSQFFCPVLPILVIPYLFSSIGTEQVFFQSDAKRIKPVCWIKYLVCSCSTFLFRNALLSCK
jgi:hypothetical protein